MESHRKTVEAAGAGASADGGPATSASASATVGNTAGKGKGRGGTGVPPVVVPAYVLESLETHREALTLWIAGQRVYTASFVW